MSRLKQAFTRSSDAFYLITKWLIMGGTAVVVALLLGGKGG